MGKSEMPFAAFAFDKEGVDPSALDNSQDTGVETAEDIATIFERYYFGCEADDSINAWAFNRRVNPMGATRTRYSVRILDTSMCRI